MPSVWKRRKPLSPRQLPIASHPLPTFPTASHTSHSLHAAARRVVKKAGHPPTHTHTHSCHYIHTQPMQQSTQMQWSYLVFLNLKIIVESYHLVLLKACLPKSNSTEVSQHQFGLRSISFSDKSGRLNTLKQQTCYRFSLVNVDLNL